MKYSFTAITKHIDRKRVGLSDPRIMHPEREWVTGLVIAGCMFLIGASFSANLYIRNRDVSVSVTANANDAVVYRESTVKDALNYLSAREEKLQKLLSNTSAVAPAAAPVSEVVEEPEPVTETEILTEEESIEPTFPSITPE